MSIIINKSVSLNYNMNLKLACARPAFTRERSGAALLVFVSRFIPYGNVFGKNDPIFQQSGLFSFRTISQSRVYDKLIFRLKSDF